jgi:hypothetical protein
MNKKYQYSEQKGLPGGPNEVSAYGEGFVVSSQGQWEYPGMNTAVPTPTGRITMDNVPYPVYGQDETGYGQMMYPGGGEYQFRGNMVYEIPYTNMATLPQHFMGNYGLEKYQTGKETVEKKKPLRIDTETYETNPLTADYVDFGKDNPYYRGAYYIPEEKRVGVTFEPIYIVGKRTGWGKDVAEYQKKNPLDKFVKDKMQDYIKSQGRFGKNFGVTMENFPENVQQNYINEYYYKLNSYAAKRIAKQKGYNLSKREDWVDKLSDREREIFANSEYGSSLQPDIPTRTRAGGRAFLNTLLPGQPVGYDIPGLSPKEQEEYKNSVLSGFDILAPIDYLGTTPANYAKNRNLSTGSDYAELPSFASGQKMGNVTDLDVMALNPVNYADAAGLIKSLPTIGRTIGTVSRSGYNIGAKGVQRVADVFRNRPEPVDVTDEVVRRVIARLDARNAPINLTPLENPQQLRFDFGDAADQYRASNQLPPPPSEIEIPTQLISNASRASRRTRRYPIENLPPSPENLFDIEDLRRAYHNSTRVLSPEEYRYLNDVGFGDPDVYEMRIDLEKSESSPANSFDLNSIQLPGQPPALRNRSRMTKENAMSRVNEAAKDKLSKMSDDEFEQTIITTKGDIVPYYQESLENYFSGPNNVTALSPEQYINSFNQNLNRLNEIIANKNTSGVQYRVKGLTPEGRLMFETPEQIVNGKKIESGTQNWGVDINPGQWRGEVADIASKEYFKSIPGIGMRTSSAGVFPYGSQFYGTPGTRAYESINEYLKELGLGRVKPGFNSQTASEYDELGNLKTSGAFDVWKNFIDKDKAVGYYGNPFAVYGVMRQVGGDMEMGLPNTGVNFEDIPDDVLAIMIANNRLK